MAEHATIQNRERVVELLQAHVQSQKDAIQTLERKAMHNLTIVNIIAGIVAAFNLPSASGEARVNQLIGGETTLYAVAMAFSVTIVVLCALVAYLSITTLWVKRQRTHPMEPTEQNAQDWSACDPEYFVELLQISYLQIYTRNARIVDAKGSRVVWSHRLIVFIIVAILFGSGATGLASIAATHGG